MNGLTKAQQIVPLLIIVALFAGQGCSQPAISLSDRTLIRIANRSSGRIEHVRIRFPTAVEDYGDIAAGQASEYRRVSKAYRYAYIEASVEGKPAVLLPEDYVGESLLRPGRYTYALSLNPQPQSKYDRLRLECVLDIAP